MGSNMTNRTRPNPNRTRGPIGSTEPTAPNRLYRRLVRVQLPFGDDGVQGTPDPNRA
jgi:hypothetical protein